MELLWKAMNVEHVIRCTAMLISLTSGASPKLYNDIVTLLDSLNTSIFSACRLYLWDQIKCSMSI